MSDIAERLRRWGYDNVLTPPVVFKAADQIEWLRAANAELLAALKETVDDVADYAQYLGQLAEKWGVAADVERYRNIISKFDDVAPTASTIPASSPRLAGRSVTDANRDTGGTPATQADVPGPAPEPHSMWNGARL